MCFWLMHQWKLTLSGRSIVLLGLLLDLLLFLFLLLLLLLLDLLLSFVLLAEDAANR